MTMHILQWPYNVDIHLLFCFYFDLHFTCSCFVHVHQHATLRNPCYDSSLIFYQCCIISWEGTQLFDFGGGGDYDPPTHICLSFMCSLHFGTPGTFFQSEDWYVFSF